MTHCIFPFYTTGTGAEKDERNLVFSIVKAYARTQIAPYNKAVTLMRNFFRALQEKHNKNLDGSTVVPVEETEQYAALAPSYLRFSKQSALKQSDEVILRELRELLQVQGITHVAFAKTGAGTALLLGTTHIYITDPKSRKEHDIGEFIVCINPAQKSILFKNITGPLRILEPESQKEYVFNHPHVYSDGRMCIEMNMLNEYLTEYKIASLAFVLIRALHTVDSVPIPLARLSNWPVKGDTP